jgi:hypothetical protein
VMAEDNADMAKSAKALFSFFNAINVGTMPHNLSRN